MCRSSKYVLILLVRLCQVSSYSTADTRCLGGAVWPHLPMALGSKRLLGDHRPCRGLQDLQQGSTDAKVHAGLCSFEHSELLSAVLIHQSCIVSLSAGCNLIVAVQRAPHLNFLGTPHYEEWRYVRKMLNPAFSPDNIRKVSLNTWWTT